MLRPITQSRAIDRAGFSLVEMILVVAVLAMLARMLVETSSSMGRVTSSATVEGILQLEGEEALASIVGDLRHSGFHGVGSASPGAMIGGKSFPYVFDDGAPPAFEFGLHVHASAPATARPNDPDFGPQRSIVFVLPSDLDRDERPELDADGDGWPELDGNGDGLHTDDPSDVDSLWDELANTIHPDTGLVWSHNEVSYVVVVLVDGSRVLQRRVDNDPATAKIVARHVERVQFDTPESSGWTVPLGAVRVQIFFRMMDKDGRLYRARNEVTVRLRNG